MQEPAEKPILHLFCDELEVKAMISLCEVKCTASKMMMNTNTFNIMRYILWCIPCVSQSNIPRYNLSSPATKHV